MEKIILIKYGELTTKKANRNLFVNTLYNNIKSFIEDMHNDLSIADTVVEMGLAKKVY